ncbi:Hypothetical predicted protein [Olea europaea subsp. europaea]|uniref:Uncharacterized protein n=1 Tax=Olea europaea subsp. europaea TaxID=158383 RepID=A0A8S0PXY6_OLEEU|nr:Hypothetical predicted protein [Olea europaea subsp. europaea]
MYNELEGLFWVTKEAVVAFKNADNSNLSSQNQETEEVKKIEVRRRRLWEFLDDDDPEEGLDLSSFDRFAFSVDDALNLNIAGSTVSRKSLLLSKLKHGL